MTMATVEFLLLIIGIGAAYGLGRIHQHESTPPQRKERAMSDLVSQIAWFHIAEQQKVNPETSRKCAETLGEIIKEENSNGRI